MRSLVREILAGRWKTECLKWEWVVLCGEWMWSANLTKNKSFKCSFLNGNCSPTVAIEKGLEIHQNFSIYHLATVNIYTKCLRILVWNSQDSVSWTKVLVKDYLYASKQKIRGHKNQYCMNHPLGTMNASTYWTLMAKWLLVVIHMHVSLIWQCC